MSKWIDDDVFNNFVKEKKEEEENNKRNYETFNYVWPNPQKGTAKKPSIYTIRFMMDKNKKFYEKYFYHFYKVGDEYFSCLCPKTWDFKAFCPHCCVSSTLYAGNKDDKSLARIYNRKLRFVGNILVVDDPRDEERDDDDKMEGKVKIYEFPETIEKKLKEELRDDENTLKKRIFDPGPEGYDFILKIGIKKSKDQEWPDYNLSQFARKPRAIGSDSEIEEYMNSTYDLIKHLKAKEKTDEEVMEVLKSQMLFDLVKESWISNKKANGEDYTHLLEETETTETETTETETTETETTETETTELEDLDEDLRKLLNEV
ncbi:MAG: hypothetical protein ACOC56_02200 [Atribacterota bacterium]